MRGFVKRKLTEDVVINMTNFDTPTIDTILSRFPVMAEDIFKELDSKSMVKCRKMSVPWQNFIDNQRFIWIRRMQKCSGNMQQFYEQWKLAIRNTPTDHVRELSKLVEQFFDDNILEKKLALDNHISGRRLQWAPLHATAFQGHLELSRYIIQKTGDKNPIGSYDITPLHFAACNGHTEVCRHIVELVDNKNPVDDKGHNPLTIAAFKGHLEIYQLIAELLEDKNPSNNDGLSSLHLASQTGHFEVCKYIMDNLLDKNPPAGGINAGLTPYHIAASFGQLKICKLFLETLADKNPFDTLYINTPLHQAAYTGHLEVCKLILESIEDKNPVAIDGVAPLHCASQGGHLEILQLFLDNGVDRRFIYNGWTPIQIAASYGHFRSCLFLMGNLQDIVSFFKGIWNHNSTKAKILVNTLICLFGAMVIMLIIAVFFQIGTGIGKNSPAYNKHKMMCKDAPMGKFLEQPLRCWGKPGPPGWKKLIIKDGRKYTYLKIKE